uniref:Uncharacterized protein n=1 Tax=Romanomermis culicivorax TaxID=13658 RepID=A0A915JB64_ROMCU
ATLGFFSKLFRGGSLTVKSGDGGENLDEKYYGRKTPFYHDSMMKRRFEKNSSRSIDRVVIYITLHFNIS